MRCRNCGWDNAAGVTECEKCHSRLEQGPGLSTEINSSHLAGTVSESVAMGDSMPAGASDLCPKCGYPVAEGSVSCPNCGAEITKRPAPRRVIQHSGMGTVMAGPAMAAAGSADFCTLRPIAWQGEEVNYQPVTYTGDEILLNRANTDANNNTITSRQQAKLTCEEGQWYIENCSDLRSTYLRVDGKTPLKSGDIIVLGNREFEFKG